MRGSEHRRATSRRRIPAAKPLVVLALAVLATEAAAAAALLVLVQLRPTRFGVPKGHFLSRVADVDDARLRQRAADPTYDPVLGWRNAPGTEQSFVGSAGRTWTIHYDAAGARRDRSQAAAEALVASFGDSFTQCDEVDDDETWQHHLATLVAARTLNFGVGAYGTDQALLLLERKLASGLRTPIVVLAIYEENINRVVNRYRLYYQPFDPMTLAFKPRFVLDERGLTLLPNPLTLADGHPKRIADYLADAARDDHWFAYNEQRPRVAFPFVYQLANLALEVAAEKQLIAGNPLAPLPRDLWRQPAPRRLMTALVQRFVEVSRAYDVTPVLLVIPDVGDPDLWHSAARPYRDWLAGVRAELGARELRVVDVADAIVDPRTFRVRSDGGHASPEGNRAIARALSTVLVPLVSPALGP